ncbi:MAG: shikimate kinase [Rhodospirillaceae bacterium]|nr:shikimate kinase [Rhodospirillaceae bacterium]
MNDKTPDPTSQQPPRQANPLIVLIGLMGAGKSSIGRRLAKKMDIPFNDADEEIEKAAGLSVSDIFEIYGEAEFRALEHRVIVRMLGEGPQVLATGGGAFMQPAIRTAIRASAISVWLKADLKTLMERTSRRGGRPLLEKGDPEAVLEKLMDERYPVYGEADITIESNAMTLDQTVNCITDTLANTQADTEKGRKT